MKKALSVLLILAVFACCFCVSAEEYITEDMPVAGLTFICPQAFIDAKGYIGTDGVFPLGNGIYCAYWYYCAAGPEEFQRMAAEDQDALQERTDLMFYVFSVGENQDLTAAGELIGQALSPEDAIQLGQLDTWTFWLYITQNPDFGKTVEQEYADEYASLCAMKDEIASAFICSVPFNEYGKMDNEIVRFPAVDLDGNPVSTEELFSQHTVTMVNIWATWCGPCVSELTELQTIHTRFLEKDCAVLGLMIDSDVEAARSLIEANGITYPVVIAPVNMSSLFPFEVIPTTFYVDSNGAFLGTKITGAQPDLYESALEPLLKHVRDADR